MKDLNKVIKKDLPDPPSKPSSVQLVNIRHMHILLLNNKNTLYIFKKKL